MIQKVQDNPDINLKGFHERWGIILEKFDSEKLIARIEEAKGWLDKAKDEYDKANPVRGGLILNLAQAEVKSAWELSHSQFVSKTNQHSVPVRKSRYFIPVAAALVLVTGLVIGVKVGGNLFNLSEGKVSKVNISKSQPQFTQKGHLSDLENRSELVSTKSKQLTSAPRVIQSNNNEFKTQIVETRPVNKLLKPDSLPEYEPGINSNKVLLKPVSRLSIDEEALTKEASHSLWNGK